MICHAGMSGYVFIFSDSFEGVEMSRATGRRLWHRGWWCRSLERAVGARGTWRLRSQQREAAGATGRLSRVSGTGPGPRWFEDRRR